MTEGALAAAVRTFGAGVRRRVADLGQAEDRLSRFAFREEPPRPATRTRPGVRHFVLRALDAGSDGDAFRLLDRLVRHGDATLDEIAAWMEADRLAVVDRLSTLAHAGLIARDLEHDRAGATPLAAGFVELVQHLTAAAEDAS